MTTTRILDAAPTVNGVNVVRVGVSDPDVWAADDNRMRVRHLAAEHGGVILRGFGFGHSPTRRVRADLARRPS